MTGSPEWACRLWNAFCHPSVMASTWDFGCPPEHPRRWGAPNGKRRKLLWKRWFVLRMTEGKMLHLIRSQDRRLYRFQWALPERKMDEDRGQFCLILQSHKNKGKSGEGRWQEIGVITSHRFPPQNTQKPPPLVAVKPSLNHRTH